jgi:Spy/CpxP family protein refolding chaperone
MIQRPFLKLLGLGLAATLATTTAAAWADAPQSGTPKGPSGHQRFQQRLGLSDQQMAAIKEVNARHSAERKQLAQSLREARNELKLAALNGGDVKGKAAAVTALVGQMTELHATTLQEIAPILTPEQRDAMAKMSPAGPHHRHRGPRSAES